MQYLSNRLADLDKICMSMHIIHFNLSNDHKFENPTLRRAAILKIEKQYLVRPILTKYCMVV